jgi:hypothetical protein
LILKVVSLFCFTFCVNLFCISQVEVKSQELDTVTILGNKSNFKIFDPSKTFVYDAYFIEANGDTLTKEKIIFKDIDEKWTKIGVNQTKLKIIYKPDSLNLEKFIHPLEGFRKRIAKGKLNRANGKRGWSNYTWIDQDEVTGIVENDTLIWFHPPRSNQYKYTYLSAYPEIRFSELKPGGNWKSKLLIMRAFPSNEEFVGSIINDIKVIGTTSDSVGIKLIPICWKIESIDAHSKLGNSKSTFIFDEKYYGFIRMEFEYYNGVKIIFRLKEVIEI